VNDSVARYDDDARARFVDEPPKRPGRTAFERDRARVVHSSALRRLGAKTQVVGPAEAESDFPRTRLTHSLECAQVGRELGATLGCDPDLVETACLAHDLGHPPFGHNGEAALDQAAKAIGGFEGNAQSFRLLTRLEAKTVTDDGRSAGLNLTRASLDAATKYPWGKRYGDSKFGVYGWRDVLPVVVEYYLPDAGPAELEAGIHSLTSLPCWPAAHDGSLNSLAALKNLTSQLIGRFCQAAEAATREAYGRAPLTRYDADLVVPRASRVECALLKGVTAHYVMNREGVSAIHSRQRALLLELVEQLYVSDGLALEPLFRTPWAAAPDDAARLRVAVDQVASLTDTSAVIWHRRASRGES
jgi:dGTPase